MTGLPDPLEIAAEVSKGLQQYDDPLACFREFTVLHRGGAKYAVRGKTISYAVDADEGTCGCGDFIHRKSLTRDDCKHLAALRLHLEIADRTCCWCRGPGCFRCLGSGRQSVEAYERGVEILKAIAVVTDRLDREALG